MGKDAMSTIRGILGVRSGEGTPTKLLGNPRRIFVRDVSVEDTSRTNATCGG